MGVCLEATLPGFLAGYRKSGNELCSDRNHGDKHPLRAKQLATWTDTKLKADYKISKEFYSDKFEGLKKITFRTGIVFLNRANPDWGYHIDLWMLFLMGWGEVAWINDSAVHEIWFWPIPW